LEKIYGFALVPDLIMYMRVNAEDLIPRALDGKGFNYWESGMDMALADNMFDSYINYQNKLITELDVMSKKFGFTEVDGSRTPDEIFETLKGVIEERIESVVEA
jgi:dTMP kinase